MTNKKVLSVFSLVMINVIVVDSIRTLPIGAAMGWSVIFYYVMGGLFFMIPIALVAAELTSAMPAEGGIYVWTREAFGPAWGLFVAWVQWVYNLVWFPSIIAFLAMTVLYAIHPVMAANRELLFFVMLIMFWFTTAINCFGMRLASSVSTVCALVGTIFPLIVIIMMGGWWWLSGHALALPVTTVHFFPQRMDMGNVGFLTGILFGLIGLEMSAIHASDVQSPRRDYPRALLISVIVILTTLILGSLSIAIVVPAQQVNLAAGVMQAFAAFLSALGLLPYQGVLAVCVVVGGLGSVAAWILGPGRCLLVASREGVGPALFEAKNRHGAPAKVLLIQAILFTFLSGFYLYFPDFNTAYWLLTAVTAQLALLLYIVFFCVAIKLRYSHPRLPREFTVPGGNVGIWVVSGVGIIGCALVFVLGFIPPQVLHIHPIWKYELMLVSFVLGLAMLPFIYLRLCRKR